MGALALKTNLLPEGMIYELGEKKKIVLDSGERLDLQRYLLEGMVLPSEDEAMKAAFLLDDKSLKDFKDLQNAFKGIREHCTEFYQGAYTKSVNIASSIIEFNFAAKYYLKGIAEMADKFAAGTVTEKYAEEAVQSLIKILMESLSEYTALCEEVNSGINDFEVKTRNDNVLMNGQDGKSGLKKEYDDKYSLNDTDIKQIQDDIDEAMRELDQASKEYNYDVTVAATTPTYAWIFPLGTIPAVVVAGVYGDRATKAYKKMCDLKEKIKKSEEELKKKIAMVSCLTLADKQVSEISDLVKKAIEPIEKIKSSWLALSDDLSAVSTTIQKDISQLPMIVKKLGVDKALAQWEDVAEMAKEYREHAFISELSEETAACNIIPFPIAAS